MVNSIGSEPDGQQEADEENKDGGDNKETGADTKTIAEYSDTNISKIHHQSYPRPLHCLSTAKKQESISF
jgi:hypothetical protein